MAALLSNAVNDTEKIAIFVAECQRMKIPICPPDVNRSQLKFAPENTSVAARLDHDITDTGAVTDETCAECCGIRFGLAAIKNVGAGAMASAIEERPHGEGTGVRVAVRLELGRDRSNRGGEAPAGRRLDRRLRRFAGGGLGKRHRPRRRPLRPKLGKREGSSPRPDRSARGEVQDGRAEQAPEQTAQDHHQRGAGGQRPAVRRRFRKGPAGGAGGVEGWVGWGQERGASLWRLPA